MGRGEKKQEAHHNTGLKIFLFGRNIKIQNSKESNSFGELIIVRLNFAKVEFNGTLLK